MIARETAHSECTHHAHTGVRYTRHTPGYIGNTICTYNVSYVHLEGRRHGMKQRARTP